MGQGITELNICLLVFFSFILIYSFNNYVLSLNIIIEGKEKSWLVRLILNILNYSTIFVPGYLVYIYVRNTTYLEKTGGRFIRWMLVMCLGEGDGLTRSQTTVTDSTNQKSTSQKAVLIIMCFLGLQCSYLSWGLLQEKVMTQEYKNDNGEKGRFTDSQFLVLINRVLAFCLSGSIILIKQQPSHRAPLYKFMYCSLSNILSSWCQYEALKYVTFPNQVVAKAGKVIPVMLMGKIISRTKYEYYEYITAGILSIGMIFFMLGTSNEHSGSSVTTLSGLILLVSYVVFDSFTSNWQSALFKTYGVSSLQMMCAVNLYSCLFTVTSLLQQDRLASSIHFMLQFPRFTVDCLLLSMCSALGQIVIFYTIATFGPVVFIIIMTVRQCLAILLSCIVYHHYISWIGIFGLILVFSAVFLRIYCNQRIKIIKKQLDKNILKV